MVGCCGHKAKFEGVSAAYKRRLWLVIALNAAMFIVEMATGHAAKSKGLQADALDFLADALTYSLSLAMIGRSIQYRSLAALLKGLSLGAMGVWVFGSSLYRLFYLQLPSPSLMTLVGVLALLANLISLLVLLPYRDGDANIRSVWLCSRNDALGNIAVMVAALAVWLTGSGWADVLVAMLMASLFLSSSSQIIRQALTERQAAALS